MAMGRVREMFEREAKGDLLYSITGWEAVVKTKLYCSQSMTRDNGHKQQNEKLLLLSMKNPYHQGDQTLQGIA